MAFVRGDDAISIAPRLALGLGGDWRGTTVELPDGEWRDEMTGDVHAGGRAPVARLLGRFPVALLARASAAAPGRVAALAEDAAEAPRT